MERLAEIDGAVMVGAAPAGPNSTRAAVTSGSSSEKVTISTVPITGLCVWFTSKVQVPAGRPPVPAAPPPPRYPPGPATAAGIRAAAAGFPCRHSGIRAAALAAARPPRVRRRLAAAAGARHATHRRQDPQDGGAPAILLSESDHSLSPQTSPRTETGSRYHAIPVTKLNVVSGPGAPYDRAR